MFFCNSRKLIKRLLAPAHRRRPNAISFCSVAVFRRRRKTSIVTVRFADSFSFFVPQKQIGRTSQGKTACFPLWRLAKQEAHANHPFPLFRPNANSFFEKHVTGKHTKKEFGRTLRGKSGFPSVPLESSFF